MHVRLPLVKLLSTNTRLQQHRRAGIIIRVIDVTNDTRVIYEEINVGVIVPVIVS